MTTHRTGRRRPPAADARGDSDARDARPEPRSRLVRLLDPRDLSRSGGLSLGWTLALGTSLAVTLVLGSVTALQERSDVRREQEVDQALLAESIAPLATRLEAAADADELRRLVRADADAYRRRGIEAVHLRLDDAQGHPLADAGDAELASRRTLRARVPVDAAALPGGAGVLTVERDAPAVDGLASHLWHEWLMDLGVAAAAVVVVLLALDTLLITRPLTRLVRLVRAMAEGYRITEPPPRGPREIRQLAVQFRDTVESLERTMQALLAAERPAPPDGPGGAAGNPGAPGGDAVRHADDERRTRDELERALGMLAAADPRHPETRRRAREVWERGATEAERRGLHDLQIRLETAALRILEPESFADLDRALGAITASRRGQLEAHRAAVRDALETAGVPFLQIQHRVKSLPSVWRKMALKGLTLDDVQDLFALRVIVPGEADLYHALQVVHGHYRPRILRFKDYVRHPKANGYQALHTTVDTGDGPCIEIQIRTLAMHERAEHGPLTHWSRSGAGRRDARPGEPGWSALADAWTAREKRLGPP